ncbi:hypothetical protein FOA52_006503 [Chlamydomonas sp. UWO 241]|nr:hypothetical protein FOA52_006503 [Chlamydomonas sp. UWO 241]
MLAPCTIPSPSASSTLGSTPEVDAARAYDWAAVRLHGPGYIKRNFPGELISEPPASRGGKQTSRFNGVTFLKASSGWRVHLQNPETKRSQYIGSYACEEDAARSYECAAVKLHGPGYAKRNFPGELITEPPASPGDAKSSSFNGVSWNKASSTWVAKLKDPKTKRRRQYMGSYASEEDAARAYDCAAVKLHGPYWPKRNFPDEVISKPPVSLGAKQRESEASSFHIGVTWHKAASAWVATLYKPQRKHIGLYTSEVDAARAYDCAAVELHGPGYAKRNFPGEVISEPPVSLGAKRRKRKASQ